MNKKKDEGDAVAVAVPEDAHVMLSAKLPAEPASEVKMNGTIKRNGCKTI